MRSFALWGARRSDVQVGGREDRRYAARKRREAERVHGRRRIDVHFVVHLDGIALGQWFRR